MQIAALLNVANYVAKYPNFPFDSDLFQPLLILTRGENNRTEEFCNCPDNAITFA
jgi:hypothetical protein